MAKHIQEYKYLVERIAELEQLIDDGVDIIKNEALLECMKNRLKNGNVQRPRYTKIWHNQAKKFL